MSRAELVQGGIALVVGAFSCTGNIGRQVTLERFIAPNDSAYHCDGYFDADHEGLWIVGADDLQRLTEDGIIRSDIAAHVPRHLLPIDPPAKQRVAELAQSQRGGGE